MKGFNRRGLFRMKQFYETYSNPDLVTKLLTQSESKKIVSALVTQIQLTKYEHDALVSLVVTLMQKEEQLLNKFVSGLLAQI